MFKPTKMLKVVSVILIVLAVLGVASVAFSYAMMPSMKSIPGMDTSLLEEAYTPLNLVISSCGFLLTIVAGVLGIKGKQFKIALGAMVIYIIYTVYTIFTSISTLGFSVTYFVNLVLPILYLWGLYQSKE
ncbi:MAG: hypothetical protein RSA90_05685 [Lachnospiraceae bacterium]